MKKTVLMAILAGFFVGCDSAPKVDNSTVQTVDLNRYVGRWYEVAKFDHYFERGMDYAMANYAYQNSTLGYGGHWWLRSPYYYYKPGYPNKSYEKARYVYYNGNTFSSSVQEDSIGVVPALSISLQ